MLESHIGRIELSNVSQSFTNNGHTAHLFKNLNLTIEQGQSYAITGPSGSGKSSLLMVMSGLAEPTTGHGHYTKNKHIASLAQLREKIGFIFQQFHLLPELTTLHNVALPLKLRGQKDAENKAKAWLEKVGLEHRLHHMPMQLSGGEQQRAAIARALVFEPNFIFADEPTGNLDRKSAEAVTDILFSCCQEKAAGLVLVTHSDTLAARAEHVLEFQNGGCAWVKTPQPEVQYA